MSALRYRICIVKNDKDIEKSSPKIHKSLLVLSKDKTEIKKWGTSLVGSLQSEIHRIDLPRISAKVYWGKDTCKIVDEICEHKFPFCVVFIEKPMNESCVAKLKKLKKECFVHVCDLNEGQAGLDVGLGKWVRELKDLDVKLYDDAPKLTAKASSAPSPKKELPQKDKVKAVKSTSPNPPKKA